MHSRDGEWLFVPPVEGAIVVNVGDLLMRWSNDVLRSTPHCVMDDPRIVGDVVPARYSMAYFCNPSRDTLSSGGILCPPDTPLLSSFLRTATMVVGRSVSARAASIDRAYAFAHPSPPATPPR